MIIDCFMFGLEYELDLLEIRLDYLNDVVDHFVLVEAKFTQQGYLKPLFFELNKKRFQKYENKIVHVVVDKPMTTTPDTWLNENYQRNQILSGLDKLHLQSEDVIIVSDLDEIPSIKTIEKYKTGIHEPAVLNQRMFYYYLNLEAPYTWNGSQFVRYRYFYDSTPQQLRHQRVKCARNISGGWHFSYLGGVDAVFDKINAVCESHYHAKYKDKAILQQAIDSRTIHFNGEKLKKVNIDDSFPTFDIEKFKHLII